MMQSFVDRFNGIIAASYLAERMLCGVEVGYSEERITKMVEDNFEEMEAWSLSGERFLTAEYLAEIQYAFGVETDICEMGRILSEYCEFQKSVLLSKTLFGVQDMFRSRGWKRFSNLRIDRKTLYPLALLLWILLKHRSVRMVASMNGICVSLPMFLFSFKRQLTFLVDRTCEAVSKRQLSIGERRGPTEGFSMSKKAVQSHRLLFYIQRLEPLFDFENHKGKERDDEHDTEMDPESILTFDERHCRVHGHNIGIGREREKNCRENSQNFHGLIQLVGKERVVSSFHGFDGFLLAFEHIPQTNVGTDQVLKIDLEFVRNKRMIFLGE